MLIDRINIYPDENKNYPFNLELYKSEINLDLKASVVLFLGENGCGKSTLLKIIQSKLNLIRIKLPNTSDDFKIDNNQIKVSPSLSKVKGFFFESIAFINYIEYVQNEISESKENIQRVEKEYKNRSNYAKMMAKSPYSKTIYELENMYSQDLSKSSHGESYLDFFSSRIKDNQLYLLDEPETPLSIQNQLTLTAMIIEATKRGCQFLIATHSPILAAINNAIIYEIKNDVFTKVKYDDIESIKLLKQFLNNKDQFLRYFEWIH